MIAVCATNISVQCEQIRRNDNSLHQNKQIYLMWVDWDEEALLPDMGRVGQRRFIAQCRQIGTKKIYCMMWADRKVCLDMKRWENLQVGW